MPAHLPGNVRIPSAGHAKETYWVTTGNRPEIWESDGSPGGTVQVSGAGNIVYAQTSVSATMSDFAISVSPSNSSVLQAGDTAVYTVQLTPNPLYTSPISLSCTGTPANSSCKV